ncbi:MAG: hypothetical protein AAFX75_11065 [Pseudomonadota bacterium]
MTIADRSGRVLYRPKRIAAQTLPYDSVNIESAIDDLERIGKVHRYVVGGRSLLQVCDWDSLQSPHHKEPNSELPGPESPDSEGDSNKEPCLDHALLEHESTIPGDDGANSPDSGLLTIDQGPLTTDMVDGGGGVEADPGDGRLWYALTADAADRFLRAWDAFGQHGDRARAAHEWQQLEVAGAITCENTDTIVEAARKARATHDASGEELRHLKRFHTWLAKKGFSDALRRPITPQASCIDPEVRSATAKAVELGIDVQRESESDAQFTRRVWNAEAEARAQLAQGAA